MRAILFALFFALSIRASAAQSTPSIQGEALDGTAVRLPDAQRPVVLVLGFSRKASDDVMAWGKKLTNSAWNGSAATVFEGAMLAGVPKPLRGFVVRSMRKQVPARAQSHFVPLYSDEAQWKQIAGYSAADDAYILLIDSSGALRWKTHGGYSDAVFEQVTKQVESLRSR